MSETFPAEYVRELRNENKRRRLRVIDLEEALIAKEIAIEADRQGLSQDLIEQVQTLMVVVGDKGVVHGAREAVLFVKARQ